MTVTHFPWSQKCFMMYFSSNMCSHIKKYPVTVWCIWGILDSNNIYGWVITHLVCVDDDSKHILKKWCYEWIRKVIFPSHCKKNALISSMSYNLFFICIYIVFENYTWIWNEIKQLWKIFHRKYSLISQIIDNYFLNSAI